MRFRTLVSLSSLSLWLLACPNPAVVLPCGPTGAGSDPDAFTIAITASQSQLQGWSTQPEPFPLDWASRSCVYRADDGVYLRAHGPFLASPSGSAPWFWYSPGPWNDDQPVSPLDYRGPLGALARRIVEDRNENVRILSTAVGNTRLVWHHADPIEPEWRADCTPAEQGPPAWCGVEWDARFVGGLSETQWSVDLVLIHIGEGDAGSAQLEGKTTTPPGDSETYAEMYAGMYTAITEAHALTGAPVMVVPVSKNHCRFSWPACTTTTSAWVSEIHDAQIAAAADHPQGCVGPDPSFLQLEPIEPFADEIHYHDVVGFADAIAAALPGCGV